MLRGLGSVSTGFCGSRGVVRGKINGVVRKRLLHGTCRDGGTTEAVGWGRQGIKRGVRHFDHKFGGRHRRMMCASSDEGEHGSPVSSKDLAQAYRVLAATGQRDLLWGLITVAHQGECYEHCSLFFFIIRLY